MTGDCYVTYEDIRVYTRSRKEEGRKQRFSKRRLGTTMKMNTSAWNGADARASIQKKSAGQISIGRWSAHIACSTFERVFTGPSSRTARAANLIDHVSIEATYNFWFLDRSALRLASRSGGMKRTRAAGPLDANC